MKASFLLVALTLVSSTALADGYRCRGQGHRVKLYHHVSPELGTRNPAALVVSQQGIGTVAVVDYEELERRNLEDTVIYEGQTNSDVDGRFVYASLTVDKEPRQTGSREGTYDGLLTLRANGDELDVELVCERYRKLEPRGRG